MTSLYRSGPERLYIGVMVWLALGGIAFTPFYQGGMMTASVSVMVAGLLALLLRRWRWQAHDNPLAVVNTVFAVFALGSAAIVWSRGDRLAEMEQFLPFLGAALLGVGFRVLPFPAQLAGLACATGAIAGATFCLHQVWSAPGVARAEISMHSTWLGTIGALYAALCASGAVWAPVSKKQKVMLALGALSGVVVALLSGSKGSWLVLVVVTPPLLVAAAGQLGWRLGALALAVVLGMAATVTLIPNSPVLPRIKEMADTGDRLRAAYWDEALDMFRRNQLLGGGREALRERLLEASLQVRQGIPLDDAPNDAHNEYFDVLATRGTTGLALTLSALLVPFAVFFRLRKDPGARAPAKTGMLFIFAFAVAGLTDVQFAVNMKRMLYLFTVMLLLASATAWPPAPTAK